MECNELLFFDFDFDVVLVAFEKLGLDCASWSEPVYSDLLRCFFGYLLLYYFLACAYVLMEKNPRILLLDEATSALDAESERIVQEALEKIIVKRTTVVVAHRLTTIRNADTIAVVHQGKIVERGTHSELTMDAYGAYSQLIHLQEGEKEAEGSRTSEADKSGDCLNIESHMARSSTQRRSFMRSISQKSSASFGRSQSQRGLSGEIKGDIEQGQLDNKEKPKRIPLTRLAKLNKPEVPVILLGSIAAIIHGVVFPIFGLLFSSVISMFFKPPDQQRKESRLWSLLYVGLGFVTLVVLPLQNYFFGIAGGKLIERVRSLTFEKIVHQEIRWFDNPANSSGAVGARLSTDASTVKSLVGFSFLALYCTNAFTFYIGSILVQHGKATFQEVFFCLTMTAISVSQSSALAPDANKVKYSTASIFEILDSKPDIDSSSKEGVMQETVVGNIELQHVSFNYPTRPHIQIFRDLNLSIPSAKTVALVGESGSGKSTVISLLERFYDPDSGHVYLDGVDITKFRLSWSRQQMGLVGQEPILFNERIRANIAYGKEGGATEDEIIAAANAADAHSFISSLPNGYETSVGERGTQLSGGQKQRIAIARAMLKNPKILLLDEATSALDAESERIVQEALDKVSVNRTTVVVAHRLTTIRGADTIAVIKNGVVAEKGRHDVLMKITD
ncbi:hypothetical protein RYX36_033098, partial [Vicia faba]